jgi:hypothetical protein
MRFSRTAMSRNMRYWLDSPPSPNGLGIHEERLGHRWALGYGHIAKNTNHWTKTVGPQVRLLSLLWAIQSLRQCETQCVAAASWTSRVATTGGAESR